MVDSGTIITLNISKGPATKKVEVPADLEGLSLEAATAKLEAVKLKVGSVQRDDSSTLEKDTVTICSSLSTMTRERLPS